MAWGQEKGTDVKISALPVSMRFFDFVPCSLPLKTLILLTFSCFLIRRRGSGLSFKYLVLKAIPYLIWPWSSTVITVAKSLANLLVSLLTFTVPSNIAFTMVL